MKTIFCVTFFLICAVVQAEESSRVEIVRRGMVYYGWITEGVTFEEIGRTGQPVLIKRADKVVGYHCNESSWERRDINDNALDGVTKIEFGDGGSVLPILFKIEDKSEIAVWIAAYRNHTEFERRFSCFLPTDKTAGFEQKRVEVQFGEVCLCSLALRFFVKDKKVLELKGHLQDHDKIGSGMRNSLMHKLAIAKLPKALSIVPSSDKEQLIDPFTEEPTPKTAEQAVAEQPATRPELKSEGSTKPQPEVDGRSR
jgi:hypothetical protein